jgi:hypothetical protein
MADVVENLNVLAKEVFGEKGVPDLVPNMTKIQQEIPFSKGEQLGLKFAQTVRLAYPNGFNHQKGDGTAGAFTFQNAKPGAQARAEMFGTQILLRDQMAYEDAAKLTGSKQAFAKGTEFFFKGLQMSMRKRLEVEMFHGGQGIGVVSTTSASSPTVIGMSAAQWCPGVWAGNEGMEIDVYSGTTLMNTNAPLVLISSDPVVRTISITGNATDVATITAGATFYYRGAFGAEMTGIHGILANTGTLFNISAATYSLWKSTSYTPTVGALTFAKVKKAIAIAVSKGLDEDCVLYMHPSTWDDVNSDIAALRRTTDKDVKKVDIGSEEIYYHSQNGVTKLVPSIYCKEGFAYGLCNPKEYWMRIGAADVTMSTPGFEGDLFLHLPSAAGVEARCYTHQAILSLAPAKQFVISNIVNTSY